MQKKSPWSRQRMEAVIIVFFAALWLLGYKAAFVAEWRSLSAAPLLMKVSQAEKRLIVWGTLYRPFRDGLSVAPENSAIYFLNYCPEASGVWNWLLAKYYFTPRRIDIAGPADTNRETALKSDFVIACVCTEMSASDTEKLGFLGQPPFKKVTANSYQFGHYAVYRIEKTGEGIR
ncbi:MAG: hypothetical protein IT392_10845 [Nitrospirae bacterium]|nr:hypothetical protein [Nitrospirota bacterium]